MVKELAGSAESPLDDSVARASLGDGRLIVGRAAIEINTPPTILVSSRSAPIRNEGLAEKIGEIVLLVARGSGIYGALTNLVFNVRVALNTNITNSRTTSGVLDVVT
jgi:hypothetical protein